MRIRWGPKLIAFVLFIGLLFCGGGMYSAKQLKYKKLQLKFSPKIIHTKPIIVTGKDQGDSLPTGPRIISTRKLIVTGKTGTPFAGKVITTNNIIVIGKYNYNNEEK